jgi:predicted transcriptional regulator
VRRKRGELESAVLAVLWEAGTPLVAAEVQERLDSSLAYTTVVTILSRLQTKGALERTQRGKAFAYAPVFDEPGLAAQRMRMVLDGEADREQVIARFVSQLSTQDENLLRSLLREHGGQPPQDGTTG